MDISWIFTNWIIIILVITLVLYLYGTRNYNYFAKQNVPFIKPKPFIGCLGPVLLRKISFADYILNVYNEFNRYAYFGTFSFKIPVVFIRDPELIKAVTVKDFDHFTDHEPFAAEEVDPLWGKALFLLQGQRWRDMRTILTPAFTSSKMKTMFVLVDECGKQLVDFLKKCSQNYTPDKVCKIEKDGDMLLVEMKDLFTRYTNDVIATAAFGVSVDSLMKPSNEFYLMGKDATNLDGISSFILLGYMFFRKLMIMLKIKVMAKKTEQFFRSLVLDTMATREREGIVRPDLIELLMQAKKGTLHDDTVPQIHKTALTDDDLAAQAFLFLFAGFDTSSTLLSFVSHQLAVYPDIQARLQEEIDTTLKKSDGIIAYDVVQSMKYLDMVISETLRIYPSQPATDRRCVQPYTLQAEPPMEISPGAVVWIPTYALHHDPEYFPDPERFDPERFSDENKHKIRPFTYLPFGAGPRGCIGNRFALMEAKIALVHLLSHFNFKVVSKTLVPLQLSKRSFNMVIDGGIWLGLEQRRIKM